MINDNVEVIGDMLMEEIGVVLVIFFDVKDIFVFEFLLGEICLWGDIDVVVLYEVDMDILLIL